MPKFGENSRDCLSTADPRWREIMNSIIQSYDCSVIEGHRPKAIQDKYFESGASKKQWPGSKHNQKPSPAIDAHPYPLPENWGKIGTGDRSKVIYEWKIRVKFYEFAAIVKYEAEQLGYKIRWGGDWDGDGDYNDQTFDDLVHFELKDD